MGFQIPSQPLSMGSLQLGQREARSVSGVIPEVSHGLVPVTPAVRWDDRLGMYSILVFGVAALVLASLGRLLATRVYLLPLWAIACYLLFFAVVDAAAAIFGSGHPSEQLSVSQSLDADLWMSFIGIPVSIFLLTVLGGIQMMGLTQPRKRMWLLGAATLIGLFVGFGMSYGVPAVLVGAVLGLLVPLPVAINPSRPRSVGSASSL